MLPRNFSGLPFLPLQNTQNHALQLYSADALRAALKAGISPEVQGEYVVRQLLYSFYEKKGGPAPIL